MDQIKIEGQVAKYPEAGGCEWHRYKQINGTQLLPSCKRSGWPGGSAPWGWRGRWRRHATAAAPRSWWSPGSWSWVPAQRGPPAPPHTASPAVALVQMPFWPHSQKKSSDYQSSCSARSNAILITQSKKISRLPDLGTHTTSPAVALAQTPFCPHNPKKPSDYQTSAHSTSPAVALTQTPFWSHGPKKSSDHQTPARTTSPDAVPALMPFLILKTLHVVCQQDPI